jgi:type VI secretion system protein ImpJ
MPETAANTREVDGADAESASRFFIDSETFLDSTSNLRIEQEIDIAHQRLSYEIRKTPKPGFTGLLAARIVEVSDKAIVFDERFAPPVLVTLAHPVVAGWLDRVIGWVETKLEELARYASDPSAGGGLQSVDYFMLQMLNREIPALKHLRGSRYVHPERLFFELLKLAGELATYSTKERRARDYPAYDHDNLETTFAPVLSDIQRFLNVDISRAIRLDITERARNAFIAAVRDRNLFRNATFVLEVAAQRPLTEIQGQFPALFKVGPNTKMNEIVHAHLPGIPLIHMPTPPSQIRAISNHVYFYLDRMSPLWPEFSTASGIGMHFSGDWPGLELDLWAIREEAR